MTEVQKLIEKAADAKEAHVAQQFAQAALNAAHALQVQQQTKKESE